MNPHELGADENQFFLEIQNQVFADDVEQHKETSVISFITENAPLFRYFSTHLPKDLEHSWKDALRDPRALKEVESRYEQFRSDIENTLSDMDPETMTELMNATDRGDVDEASRILENYFAIKESAEEERLAA